MNETRAESPAVNLELILQPETSLERLILKYTPFRRGLLWGVPRYGHPEGEVYKHVKEVLANIDCLEVTDKEREWLRIVALVHDTFKFQEDKREPRNWHRHHAVLARRFLEEFVDDEALLNIVQNHDEVYYIWRDMVLFKQPERGAQRMERLIDRLQGYNQLFYLFFKCDTQTGDKNPAPIKWVEENFPGVVPVKLK